jgi:iron complex outermembrane recepter protein
MVWGNWVALVGWRKIHYEQGDPLSPNQDAFKQSLPSLGVVYRWTPTFSLYGSTSKGFQPNIGIIDVNRRPIEPESSKQWEFGFKSLLADNQLALTGAVYEIKQRNVAVPDFDNSVPGDFFWMTVPGVTSRGGELELSGNLTPHLGLRANYAYLDKQASTPDATGIAFTRNQASIWHREWLVGGRRCARAQPCAAV